MPQLTVEDYAKRLADLKRSNSNKDFMTWEDGTNYGRVCPGHPNMDGFYTEIKQHSKGEGKSYVAVQCYGGECEICPELEEYRKSRDKEDQKVWKEQMPKSRFYFNFLSKGPKGKSTPVLKTVGCGTQILTGIMALICNEDYGLSLTDLEDGRDIIVTSGKGKNNQTEYTVQARVATGPALEDEDELQKLLDNLPDLNDMLDQFEGDASKAKLVWDEGWEALKDKDDDKPKKVTTPKDKSDISPLHRVMANKAAAKKAKPEPDEEEEEESPKAKTAATMEALRKKIVAFPRLKSRCSLCGEQRHKTPEGNICPNNHNFPQPLAEGERPSHPSKAYLKEFPEPIEEEEEVAEDEEEVLDDDIPSDEDEGGDDEDVDPDTKLGDLDKILKAHKKTSKK
jgi:hypothetical protein